MSKPPKDQASDFTDAKLAAQAVRESLRGKFCYVDNGLGWLGWEDKRWEPCTDVPVTECTRLWTIDHFEATLRLMRTGMADETSVKRWMQTMRNAALSSIVRLSRGIDGIAAKASDFDAHPDLLNVNNGVVDLRTGELRPHDPALKLTKLAPVDYHPGATHEDWTAALEAVPADVRHWYQIRCGQAITGYMTPDKKMIVQQGGGDNGKSTISSAIMAALGNYAVQVSDKVILASPDAHTTEKMELRGARFAVIEETPEARRLSVDRLKKTVGTPRMSARYVHQNEVTWECSHSLFLNTNYPLIVEETDHGTWTRLALLKYPYRFRGAGEPCTDDTDRPGDPDLLARLSGGPRGVGPAHEAALAWLVAGAMAWYAAERVMPKAPARIEADTLAWRKESDQILGFIDDELVFDKASHVMSTELLSHFNAWLDDHGHKPWGDQLFASRFGEHQEVSAQRVIKKHVKFGPGLARRPRDPSDTPRGFAEVPPVTPNSYKAWLGLKFAETGPDSPPTSQNGAESHDQVSAVSRSE